MPFDYRGSEDLERLEGAVLVGSLRHGISAAFGCVLALASQSFPRSNDLSGELTTNEHPRADGALHNGEDVVLVARRIH